MNSLEAVNLMLEAVGEHPVSDLNIRHPTVSKARTILTQQRQQMLSQAYWFNSFPVTLTPDVNGVIGIPTDTLSFVPDTADIVAIRGDRLYNGATLDFIFTGQISGTVIKDIPFDELPSSARIAVANRAAIQLYSVDIGVDNNVSIYQQNSTLALAQLDAEHVRQRKYSARNRANWRRLQMARRI